MALRRTEILGIVCDCPDKLPKSALRFLSRFDGCKLQTDKAREALISWVRTGKYERLRHHKKLSSGLLGLFDEFPMLVGAKWTHSADLAEVEMQELRISIRDLLKMADALGISPELNRDLLNFLTVADIRRHHDEVLQLYLEQTAVESNLLLPDPPLAGTRVIIPVRNSNSLFQEGFDQDNCVYSYLAEILAGQYFVYQVKGIERATLGVTIGDNGGIQLDQLLAASNTGVSSQTFEIVLCWLNSIGQESQLHMAEHRQKRIDDCMTAYMEYRASRRP